MFIEYHEGQEITHRHCNSVEYVAIHFPGGFHMMVHFESTTNKGSMDCNKVKAPAGDYVRSLQQEIQMALPVNSLHLNINCV